METQTEKPRTTKTFGQWHVNRSGDLAYRETDTTDYYVIEKQRLTEKDWIAHIAGKDWGHKTMGDFICAYFYALNNIGIKEHTITIY